MGTCSATAPSSPARPRPPRSRAAAPPRSARELRLHATLRALGRRVGSRAGRSGIESTPFRFASGLEGAPLRFARALGIAALQHDPARPVRASACRVHAGRRPGSLSLAVQDCGLSVGRDCCRPLVRVNSGYARLQLMPLHVMAPMGVSSGIPLAFRSAGPCEHTLTSSRTFHTHLPGVSLDTLKYPNSYY